jgi:hypothetical protein
LGGQSNVLSVAGDGMTVDVTGIRDAVSIAGTGNAVTVSGDAAVIQTSGSNTITLAGNAISASVEGDNDSIYLNGTGDSVAVIGSDKVTLGAGSSGSVALGGNDTVVIGVAAGDSNDATSTVITDANSTLNQSSQLDFTGATSGQLWFTQSNNDLLIRVVGSSSQIDIQGWFDGSPTAVQSIMAADGEVLTSQSVNALVAAMASFDPPPPGATALPDSYQSQLQPIIAANWH